MLVYEEVVENGRELVRARKVALGGIYNNEVEVLPTGSDVQTGSKIVVSTAERLTDGMTVRVLQDNTDTAATLAETK